MPPLPPTPDFAGLVEQLADVVAQLTADCRFLYVNRAIETMTGLPRDSFVGRRPRDLLMPASVIADWEVACAEIFRTGESRDWDFAYETPDARRWFHALAVPEHGPGGEVVTVCLAARDITRLKELELQLTREAREDHLTGLATRRHLYDVAQEALRAGPVGVCLVDIDDFKEINDHNGHAIGDAVLAIVARRLLSLVRPQDLVARYGGDEFVLLVRPCTDERHAVAVAERASTAMRQPVAAGGRTFSMSVSIGVAFGGRDINELLERADRGLYDAKTAGKQGWAVGS